MALAGPRHWDRVHPALEASYLVSVTIFALNGCPVSSDTPNLIAAVIGLDPVHFPAERFGALLHGLARLPLVHGNVATRHPPSRLARASCKEGQGSCVFVGDQLIPA